MTSQMLAASWNSSSIRLCEPQITRVWKCTQIVKLWLSLNCTSLFKKSEKRGEAVRDINSVLNSFPLPLWKLLFANMYIANYDG